MRRLSSLIGLLGLSACVVGPSYRTPAPLPPAQTSLTEAGGSAALTQGALPDHWWRLFEDPAIDRLVARALAHNSDLRQAAASLQRARALLSQAHAGRLPTSEASAQASEIRTGAGTVTTGGTNIPPGVTGFETDFYQLGFDASYELDLFGGVHRSIEAARGDVGAAQAALDAARVAIAAETARTYSDACAFALQADVARETVALQEKTLDLTQRLLSGGRGTQRDVDQATTLVEQARAQIAGFDAEHRAALYALAVLTGDPPAQADAVAALCRAIPVIARSIPVGNGQAMLARRPDVRQAERQLAADTARVGVATAALYPSVTLLGSVSLGGTDPGDLGKDKSLSWSFGPLVRWNFPFNGAARARVRESRAVADGSLAAFDKAVLTALSETEQALARLKGALDREAALKHALDASNNAAFLSEKRFDYGADSFLQLLDAQRSRASARAAYAQAQADRATAQLSLFKALGGGWTDAPMPVRAEEAGAAGAAR